MAKRKKSIRSSSTNDNCLDNNVITATIPKTDVVDELPIENFNISPVDSAIVVLDKETSGEMSNVVSNKRKRKPRRSSAAACSVLNDCSLENVSVSIPVTEVIENVPVPLKEDVSGGVSDVVSKRKKRRKCKKSSSDGGVNSIVQEDVPVDSNATCSVDKLYISSVSALGKEVSGGVNNVVAKRKKRISKRMSSQGGVKSIEQEVNGCSLDNLGVSIPKTDVMEEVPVLSNLTSSGEKLPTIVGVSEKEVSAEVNIVVSKKRKRKPKLSSVELTCLDNVSVKSVSSVTDNVSLSDINNDVMANANSVATCSVNVDSNCHINGEPEEANDSRVVLPKKRRKKKHGSLSSLEVINHPTLQLSRPLDTTTILKPRRKLLVLDVNGLLADIVPKCPKWKKPHFERQKRFRPDGIVDKKLVFKRPFCEEFLQFCFDKFDVGIWSSRTKKNLTLAVDLLMSNMKSRLLFCWNRSHCTMTNFKTCENKKKPLVLKELKKLWESKRESWFYNESNTVLLDDSPYKALRNPPFTAVHPVAYQFTDVRDKSLGPGGGIRLYLERLAEAENVQNFIKANPFGQKPITQAHPSWKFYSKIVGNYANQQDF